MNAPTSLSYHLLLAAHRDDPDDAPRLLAATIAGVVRGLVAHDAYLRAASHARARGTLARVLARLSTRLAVDANPVAALFASAPSPATLARRWNGWHRDAPLGGQTTLVEQTQGLAMSRSDADGWRTAMAQACVAGAGRAPADGDALAQAARRLGVDDAPVGELLALLRAEPQASLAQASAALAVSTRTLQRALARDALTFARVRQAARLVLAGDLLREPRPRSMTDVALQAGFFDAAHFNHAWRAACGVAPQRYREIALATASG